MTNDERKSSAGIRNWPFRLAGRSRQGWRADGPTRAREGVRHPSLGLSPRFVIHDSSVASPRSGFTLIELILVMTILTITVSITAPALANFFRGRTLDSEARRLLALTRQGQSRAVAEGMPMELWIDPAQRSVGLEAQPSYEATDAKGVQLTLDSDIQIEVVNSTSANAASPFGVATQTGSGSTKPIVSNHPDLPKIRFLPDGSVSDSSPQMLRLTGRDGASLWVAQSRSRLTYEIRSRIN
jgi:type II secretion system protein H